MIFSRRTILVFATLLPLALAGGASSQVKLETLTIVTAGGRQTFQVEVMENDEQRARGLMFRREMAADRGMLFDFKKVQPVAFWMKNTYIPLDMIFIDERGEIVNIAENTEPLSERSVPSGRPVLGVLEVNAGISRKYGIKAGDRVEHRIFRK